jgi:hypothetical protein
MINTKIRFILLHESTLSTSCLQKKRPNISLSANQAVHLFTVLLEFVLLL